MKFSLQFDIHLLKCYTQAVWLGRLDTSFIYQLLYPSFLPTGQSGLTYLYPVIPELSTKQIGQSEGSNWYTPFKVLYSSSVAWSFRQLPNDLNNLILDLCKSVLLNRFIDSSSQVRLCYVMYRSGILENMIVAVVVLAWTPFQEAVPGVKKCKISKRCWRRRNVCKWFVYSVGGITTQIAFANPLIW